MIKPHLVFPTAGLLAWSVYIITLAPTITWRNEGVDSGDLATAVAVGGVPHPPGYPTYLLLGELFKQLPFGDVAYRLNLLSASCAALTIMIVAWLIYTSLSIASGGLSAVSVHQEKSLFCLCAFSTSLILAFSDLLWSQATIAEVYTLNCLLISVLLYGTGRVDPSNERWLAPGLSGLLGLSLGNHFSVLLIAPMLLAQLFTAGWNWRLITKGVAAFCLGLSIYLIIPIRAATAPPVNWGMATTWSGFVWLVGAEAYRQFFFTIPWSLIPIRLITELYLLTETFMWWGMPIGLLGWSTLVKANRSLAYSSLAAFLLISIYAVGYNTTDSYVYLLPACLVFSLWLGWGLYELSRTLRRFVAPRIYRFIGLGVILLPLLSLWLNFADQNLSQDREAYDYAQQVLQTVEPGAIIVADNDPHTFSLWYSRYGLGVRPDVAVINSNLLPYAWYREMLRQTHADLRLQDETNQPATTLTAFFELNLPDSPLYLLTFQSFVLEGYHLEVQDDLRYVTKLATR
jgi:hypothetical protein